MNYLPKAGHALIKVEHDRLKSAFLIIEQAPPEARSSMKGEVLSIGKTLEAPGFSVGDHVIFHPHAGTLLPVPKGDDDIISLPVEAVSITLKRR